MKIITKHNDIFLRLFIECKRRFISKHFVIYFVFSSLFFCGKFKKNCHSSKTQYRRVYLIQRVPIKRLRTDFSAVSQIKREWILKLIANHHQTQAVLVRTYRLPVKVALSPTTLTIRPPLLHLSKTGRLDVFRR